MAQAIPETQNNAMRQPARTEMRGQEQRGQNTEQPPMAQQSIQGQGQGRQVGSLDNVIFVGKKPTMSYVLAVMTQLQSGQNEVHIKARGRSISRAVDVAEVVKNRFMTNISRNVSINTEIVEDREKRKLNVSTINIRMTK